MPEEQANLVLRRIVSPQRLRTYLDASAGDETVALQLYVWDRDLASAVLADIAILEVALRNALNEALSAAFGPEWYVRDIGLDDRSRSSLSVAWSDLAKAQRNPGQLVAHLMLGFWVGLIDAGGYAGREPQRFSADHEVLWRGALAAAFAGGRSEAQRSEARFTRAWVHRMARIVQLLRNRAAHHEPLISGLPLPGERDQHGHAVRLSTAAAHLECIRLARVIDRDLASWLVRESRVPRVLARRDEVS